MFAHRSRTGLTLLELVVVLAILATLTLVAVVSTDTVVDQGRYDVTRRTLDNVQAAVLGELNQTDADGTRAVTGFVADTGRLPKAVGSDPAMQLAELWSNPNNLPSFGVAASTFDTDVKLLGGWRGPYLRLPAQPAGNVKMLDGWGNPYDFTPDGSPIAPSSPIALVRSRGGPAAPYNVPLDLPTPGLTVSTGAVIGSILDSDLDTGATQPVTVKLYAPQVADGQPLTVQELMPVVAPTSANGFSFEFLNVPIGSKVLRVYQGSAKSDIIHLRVPPGGLSRNVSFNLQ